MFSIKENKSNKLPCITSLYFNLSTYNSELFDILIQSADSVFDKKTREFEFPINRLCWLVNVLRQYDEVKFIPYDYSQLNHSSNYNVDYDEFKIKPFSHQKTAIEYGLSHNGWLLLDDQGLGKTGNMIYLSQILHEKENLEHCLIICGVNGIKYNWAKEIEKFSDLSYTLLGQKISRKGKTSIGSVTDRLNHLKNKIDEFFVITNIETLRDKKFIDCFNNSENKFDLIIFDEAHRCKDPSSLSAKTLLKLKAKRCVALTGTLIVNVPENSYISLKLTQNTQSNYSMFKRFYNVYGGFNNAQVIGYKNIELLQQLIQSCALRRLKSDVLDLPDKTYITDYVELGTEQRSLYNEVQDGIIAELDKTHKEDKPLTILEEITINLRLRQVTAFPGIVTTKEIPSAKLDRAEQLISDIINQGDKIVVFGTFKGAVYELARRIGDKYSCVVCTGDSSDEEISNNINQFQNDSNLKVLLATWQKMGTGVTLTAANYLIFIDTPWTSSDFEQSSDRIYRIGQNKKVFIITLVAKDTYDERVLEIVEQKAALSSCLIDNEDKSKLNVFGEE